MLGYVKKDLLAAVEVAISIEREGRIKAETRADAAEEALRAARSDCQSMLRTIATLSLSTNQTVATQAQIHKEEQATLLEHVAPIDETPLYDPNEPSLKRMTAEEILAEPASTKQGQILRARRAAEAREREQSEEQKKEEQRRRDLIVSEEEKRINSLDFDPDLGIFTERPEPQPVAAEAQ